MSFSAVIALIVGSLLALFGGVIGHRAGKSSGLEQGKDQGALQERAENASIQNKAAAESAQARTHAEISAANASDDELDTRLSRDSRPD